MNVYMLWDNKEIMVIDCACFANLRRKDMKKNTTYTPRYATIDSRLWVIFHPMI